MATIIQGSSYIGDPTNVAAWKLGVGLLLVLSGIAIIAGFVTPIFGGLVLVSSAISVIFAFPIFTGPFSSTVTSPFLLSAALTLLGPGAFSIDARLFGRREIILPKD